MHVTVTMFTIPRGHLKMQKNEDLWYRIGYALEAARQRLPAVSAPPASPPAKSRDPRDPGRLRERFVAAVAKVRKPPLDDPSDKILDALLTVGAGTLLTRLISLWPGSRRPGLFRLFKAGTAGAAASFLAELLRPVLSGEGNKRQLEEELTDILLSGAGRGLLYAALVEPRIPGPALLQGTAYSALEYALTPWGGLEELTGSAAPHRKVPVLSVLLQNRGEEEEFLEHLVFGLALALLYDR